MNGFLQRNGFVLGGFTVVILLILGFGFLFLGPAREATEDISAQRALLASARDLIEDQVEIQRTQRRIISQQLRIQQDQRRFVRSQLTLQRELLELSRVMRQNSDQVVQQTGELLAVVRSISGETARLIGISAEILDEVREINRKMPQSTRPVP